MELKLHSLFSLFKRLFSVCLLSLSLLVLLLLTLPQPFMQRYGNAAIEGALHQWCAALAEEGIVIESWEMVPYQDDVVEIQNFKAFIPDHQLMIHCPRTIIRFSWFNLLRGLWPIQRIEMAYVEIYSQSLSADQPSNTCCKKTIPSLPIHESFKALLHLWKFSVTTRIESLCVKSAEKAAATINLQGQFESDLHLHSLELEGNVTTDQNISIPLLIVASSEKTGSGLVGSIQLNNWHQLLDAGYVDDTEAIVQFQYRTPYAYSLRKNNDTAWLTSIKLTGRLYQLPCSVVIPKIEFTSPGKIFSENLQYNAPFWKSEGTIELHYDRRGIEPLDIAVSLEGPLEFDSLRHHPLYESIQEKVRELRLDLHAPRLTSHLRYHGQRARMNYKLTGDELRTQLLSSPIQNPAVNLHINAAPGDSLEGLIDLSAEYEGERLILSGNGSIDSANENTSLNSLRAESPWCLFLWQPMPEGTAKKEESEANHRWAIQLEVDTYRSKIMQALFKPHDCAGHLMVHGYTSSWEHLADEPVELEIEAQELRQGLWYLQKLEGMVRIAGLKALSYSLKELALSDVTLQGESLIYHGRQVLDQLVYRSHQGAEASSQDQMGQFELELRHRTQAEPLDAPYDVELHGRWWLEEKGIVLSCDRLTGHWSHLPLHNLQAVRVEWLDHRWRCSQIALKIGEGQLSGLASWSDRELRFQSHLSKLPLQWMHWLLPQPLKGEVSGNIECYLAHESSFGHIDLQLHHLQNQEPIQLPKLIQGEIHTHWEGVNFTSSLTLKESSLRQFNCHAQGRWDALADLSQSQALLKQQSHDAQITVEGQLGLLSHLFTSQRFDFDGEATADWRTWGTLDHPLFDGRASLHDAYYENPTMGLTVKALNLEAIGKDHDFIIKECYGQDASEGRCEVVGRVGAYEGWRVDLNINLDRFLWIYTPSLSSLATGTIKLQGHEGEGTLQGHVQLSSTRYQLSDQATRSVATFEDYTLIYKPPHLKRAGSMPMLSHPFLAGWNLNLIVTFLPNDNRIIGRGIDSTWRGQVKLMGDLYEPRVEGKIELEEGTLRLSSSKLPLQRGEIDFIGGQWQQALMHLEAEKVVEDTTIHILLGGELASPRLQFKSAPKLSDPDLFSLLLFSIPHERLAPLQALEVAQAALQLNSGGEEDFLSKARRLLWFDRIDIQTQRDGQQETWYSLRLGKYFTEGLLVSLSRDITTDTSTQLTLELNLTRHLYLLMQLAYIDSSAINLMWKKDY